MSRLPYEPVDELERALSASALGLAAPDAEIGALAAVGQGLKQAFGRIEPPPGFRYAAAARFEERVRAHSAPRARWLGLWRPAALGLASLLVVLFSAVGVVAAHDAMPGEPLYPVKRWQEAIQLVLADGPLTRAELYVDFADRRADEIRRVGADPGLAAERDAQRERARAAMRELPSETSDLATRERVERLRSRLEPSEPVPDPMLSPAPQPVPESAPAAPETLAPASELAPEELAFDGLAADEALAEITVEQPDFGEPSEADAVRPLTPPVASPTPTLDGGSDTEVSFPPFVGPGESAPAFVGEAPPLPVLAPIPTGVVRPEPTSTVTPEPTLVRSPLTRTVTPSPTPVRYDEPASNGGAGGPLETPEVVPTGTRVTPGGGGGIVDVRRSPTPEATRRIDGEPEPRRTPATDVTPFRALTATALAAATPTIPRRSSPEPTATVPVRKDATATPVPTATAPPTTPTRRPLVTATLPRQR